MVAPLLSCLGGFCIRRKLAGFPAPRRRAIFLVVLSAVLASGIRSTAGEDGTDPERLVAEYAAAGEFAPALALARQAPRGQQRDGWFEQIATAQAGANMRSAAISTAAEIDSDQTRALALEQIGNQQPRAPLAMGGGAQADFDTLITLITTTIEPDTWIDTGGLSTIDSYPSGVYVDAQGMLHRVTHDDASGRLEQLRTDAAPSASQRGIRRRSPLRKVSLPRLERHIQLLRAAGDAPSEDMRVLAGLEEIRYVMIYPESGDLVIAGPAGDWTAGPQGRVVSRETGRPVLRLDDLVVLLRQAAEASGEPFGCSIVPGDAGLAAVQRFVAQSAGRPLPAGSRRRWFEQIRRLLGPQDVEYFGVEGDTRLAQVLIEADYHMKHIGIGLEEGTLDVPSYLDLIDVPRGQAPPPMEMLRWWFTIDYEAVLTGRDRNVFELRGQGVRLLSENELLTATGRRVHTGRAEPVNREFARRFTAHFDELAVKYPVYAELRNVFDLSVLAALVGTEGLADRVDWHMTCFLDPTEYEVPLAPAPRRVEPMTNSRKINGNQVVGAVAGGVRVDAWKLVERDAIQLDDGGTLDSNRRHATPHDDWSRDVWWWD